MPAWLPHLLLVPVYLLLGTLRHELSHALAGLCLGAEVKAIWVTPHWADEVGKAYYWPGEGRRFYFGRVLFGQGWHNVVDNRVMLLAPYATCLVAALVGIFAVPLAWDAWGDHGWTAAAILLWLSPAADVCWNVWKWLALGRGDFAWAFPDGGDDAGV